MRRDAVSGEQKASGSPIPGSTAPKAGTESYPNREELPYALRLIGGGFPFLILIGFAYGLFIALWLSAPLDPLFSGILAVWTVVALVAAVWLGRTLRTRTPTTIELSASGVRAAWSGSRPRSVDVPFGRIRSISPPRWRWINEGKASRYSFTPPSMTFESSPEYLSGSSRTALSNQEVVYLTESNLQRIQAAFERWGGSVRARQEGPLPDAREMTDSSENGDLLPPGWVKCARCGAPLRSHVEIEAGLCAQCLH